MIPRGEAAESSLIETKGEARRGYRVLVPDWYRVRHPRDVPWWTITGDMIIDPERPDILLEAEVPCEECGRTPTVGAQDRCQLCGGIIG